MTDITKDPVQPSAADAGAALGALRTEIGKAVVGNDQAVLYLVLALLCRGHVLLEGVPGVAKTLLVRALATSLDLDGADPYQSTGLSAHLAHSMSTAFSPTMPRAERRSATAA